MYKKQMTVQKVICLLSVIASVLMFVYALGLMTELYDSLYPAMTLETMAQKMVRSSLGGSSCPTCPLVRRSRNGETRAARSC